MKNFKFLALLATALLMVQCQNEELQEITETNQENVPEQIITNLENLGFNTTAIPVIPQKGGYLVEGDIFIPTKKILAADTKQRFVNVISCARSQNIRIQSNLGNVVDNEVNTAIRNWNNVNGSFLRLVRVNSNADIVINFDRGVLPSNAAGRGEFPTDGRAGRSIIINPDFFNGRTEFRAKVRSTIEHEIGHNIGFAHTNTAPFGIPVPGVGNEDDASLMNAGRAGTVRNLSINDQRALVRLYNSVNSVCN